MRRVLLVAASRLEMEPVKCALEAAGRGRWICATGGPGPRLALAAMDQVKESFDAVVKIGFCGAVAKGIGIGEIVVASEVNGVPVDQPQTDRHFRSGPVLSVDRIVGTPAEKREYAEYGAVAVEMEAAAVMERARALGLPFFCIGAVSDVADEGFTIDFNRARGRDGQLRKSSIVLQALARPWRGIPELRRLMRHSTEAAKNLGEFIAHCAF
jgi:uridine phosphorylase